MRRVATFRALISRHAPALIRGAIPNLEAGLRPFARPPRRTLAYNIYDAAPPPEKLYEGTPQEAAEEIFNANAAGDGGLEVIQPGQPFFNACVSLSREYPEKLSGLATDALA
eukprot:6275762-Prymnesium_polylepis.1